MTEQVSIKNGRPYGGGVSEKLHSIALEHGYESNQWGGRKQWTDAGREVRDGEVAHQPTFEKNGVTNTLALYNRDQTVERTEVPEEEKRGEAAAAALRERGFKSAKFRGHTIRMTVADAERLVKKGAA